MRTPFIDTHVFKHPNIPWGDFQDNPLNYSPDLLLDASDVNANIIDSSGVDDRNVAIIDQSLGMSETNVYTQNTSLTVDGWNDGTNNMTITGGNNGISIGGVSKDNVLKGVCDAGTNLLKVFKNTFLTASKSYSSDLYIYIPSDNNVIKGVALQMGNATVTSYNNIDGSWYLIENYKGVPANTKFNVFLTDASGDSTPSLDCDGDIVYMAEVSTNSINGSHFTQVTEASRGLQDSATAPTKITYDGVADFSDGSLSVASFSGMDKGSIIGIFTSTASQYYVALTDPSVSDKYFAVGVSSSKPYLWVYESGVVSQLTATDPVDVGSVFEWSSNGSLTTLKINGVSVDITIVAGSNGGQWISTVTSVDNMVISRLELLSTTIYRSTIFKHLMIRSTPLTDAESLTYANYLISKHNL